MPNYRVLCRVDAYVDYIAEVEADDPMTAAQLAYDHPGDYQWEAGGAQEFDARKYLTLDENGEEIEDTRAGDWI